MVGEELQGDAGNEGLETLQCIGQSDDVISKLLNLIVSLGDKGCDTSASCAYLLYIIDDFFVKAVACGDYKDRHLGVDEGDRPVLHLGCRIALGMDIGDFFQLQGTFQCNRIIVTTAQIEAVLGIGEDGGQTFYLLVGLQGLLHLLGNQCQFLHHLLVLLTRDAAALVGNTKGQHRKNGYLTCKGFGGSNTDLWPYVDIDTC